MKDIREAFPADEYGYFQANYRALIDSMEYEILLEESERGYSGDSWYLLEAGEAVGFLTFGWGSCSGCDALEACETHEEIESLRERLAGSILWIGESEMLRYFLEKDWELEFYGSSEEFRSFARQAVEKMGGDSEKLRLPIE